MKDANQWENVDPCGQLGPHGERVHRWQVLEETGGVDFDGFDAEVHVWRYRAWYRGEQGPLRMDAREAYADAARLVRDMDSQR